MDIAAETLGTLRGAGVDLAPGLDDAGVARITDATGLVLPPDLELLLRLAVPCGDRWPDWHAPQQDAWLARALAAPVEGVVFDVLHNGFWHSSFGDRPDLDHAAEDVARAAMRSWPRLVPVHGHRYVASAATSTAVISVMQTDVIDYGIDLADWARLELDDQETPTGRSSIPFWSSLIV